MKTLAMITLLTLGVTSVKAQTHNPTTLSCQDIGWDAGWFAEARFGATAFAGSPIGRGSLFERTMPSLQAGIGKWLTPSTGLRLSYQGFRFRNALKDKMRYHLFHADLLVSLGEVIGRDRKPFTHIDLIPYAGIGVIGNPDWERVCQCNGSVRSSHPVAISYGVQIRYPLTQSLALTAELSAVTTQKNFDRVNLSQDFGDHLWNLTAGITYTLERSDKKTGCKSNSHK